MGGGPDPNEFNKPTPQEAAQAEVALKQFDAYMQGKPYEAAYLADISRAPAQTAAAVKGQASADLAQGSAPLVTNPVQGLNVNGMARLASKKAKVMSDINQDAVSQQAAGKKTFVENAMGIQSTANNAQSGMAADAVRRNMATADANALSSQATTSSLSSLAGAGTGMALNVYNKKG